MSDEKESIVISKETIRRLIKDVRELKKNPLDNDGIYYVHDEENILKGYACIVGPEDSLYFGGYYFFEFNFPSDYPFNPPKLKYCTNDGVTRFHPNLYVNGKVCLSILNTWRGESWSSCQSIRSILLTLLTILDNKPLLHEPGINETHNDFKNYNKIIKYKNVEFSILRALSINANTFFPGHFISIFNKQIKEKFDLNKDKIWEIINKKKDENEIVYKLNCYRMNITTNWNKINQLFEKEYLNKK
jgi:ubiquitin-conjugating enzyme E2 Z